MTLDKTPWGNMEMLMPKYKETVVFTVTNAVYICSDQPVTMFFRLRQSGGPYIATAPATS